MTESSSIETLFELDKSFVDKYRTKTPPFGFNGVGYVAYLRTYSRIMDNGVQETWTDTVERVVNGTYRMQQRHIEQYDLGWDPDKAQRSAQEMYDRMWNMKFLPPGRGLWAMGTDLTEKRNNFAALNNCAFVSTKTIKTDLHKPFTFLMDASMLGVGVGFDTKGGYKLPLHKPLTESPRTYVIPDSREGWVNALRKLLMSYFKADRDVMQFDYSQVRPAGAPIKGFGGVASGPGPLRDMLEKIREILENNLKTNDVLTTTSITDIMNLVGKCVVAGNVRRCLPKGTLVHTSVGLVPIENVKPGMMAKTAIGYSRISEVVDQGEQYVSSIQTDMGEFFATRKHKMATVSKEGKCVWKRLEDLTKIDSLAFVRSVTEGVETHLPPSDEIDLPEWDTDIAWLFGVIQSVGKMTSETDINVQVVKNHRNVYYTSIYDKIIAQIKRFDEDAIITRFEDELRVSLHINSPKFFRYINTNLHQLNAIQRIPEWILTAVPDIRAAYIAGVHDTTSLYSINMFNFTVTASWKYAEDIQAVLGSLGIMSYVRKASLTASIANHMVHVSMPYRYMCTWEERCSKYSLRYLYTRKPTKGYLELGDIIPIKIARIQHNVDLVHTYDISVPEMEQFVAQGGLLVHNTAEIAFGEHDDTEFIDLKNAKVNPERNDFKTGWGWTSNNSIFAEHGMDYTDVSQRIVANGEPGLAWLENMKAYSRMGNGPDYKDKKAAGGNPCFTGDTLVAVADGRGAVSFKELAETGNDVPVYSLNKDGMVEIKWGRNPRKTRTDAELVRITLDDDTSLTVTPDHKMLLLDGTWKYAKDLMNGDSLPKFNKRLAKAASNGKQQYLRVNCNTLDSDKNRTFEHRMIAKFFDPNTYELLHDNAKKSGWLKGGIVVHHRDYNGLNNSPNNLEWMTFKDHAQFHADHDRAGENNGMYGKTHSDETKQLIGERSKERWADPSQRKLMMAGIGSEENRKIYSDNMKKNKAEWDREYYLEQERTTDLDTVWIDEKLHAVKKCIICESNMVLSWGERHAVFCSRSCANKHSTAIEARKAGARVSFDNKSRDVLHNQIMAYKDLERRLGRAPAKKEWESLCRDRKISFRLNPHTENPNIPKSYKDLKDRALVYNHRVKSVEMLSHKEDVYNITVDDNHTVGIITEFDPKTGTSCGIFTRQCLEQTLESYELCCLVETFPANNDSLNDYKRTLKFAYLYAKTVTLGKTPWVDTNRVLLKNRRIGVSQSGIQQIIAKIGIDEYRKWCLDGYDTIQKYDEIYSDWLAIPRSIKTTSVKPSGTVSLLAGATPGIHWPEDRTYIRRMRIAKNSGLIPYLKRAGYPIEDSVNDETAYVVEFPVHIEEDLKTTRDVSLWEQFEMAAFMQRYWADNQVSCTVTFDPKQDNIVDQIASVLNYYQYQLKGISMLPQFEHGAYAQMPYEACTMKEYQARVKKLKPLVFGDTTEETESERFCDGDACIILT